MSESYEFYRYRKLRQIYGTINIINFWHSLIFFFWMVCSASLRILPRHATAWLQHNPANNDSKPCESVRWHTLVILTHFQFLARLTTYDLCSLFEPKPYPNTGSRLSSPHCPLVDSSLLKVIFPIEHPFWILPPSLFLWVPSPSSHVGSVPQRPPVIPSRVFWVPPRYKHPFTPSEPLPPSHKHPFARESLSPVLWAPPGMREPLH